jgi:putative tricarboxylic transport membrane protein
MRESAWIKYAVGAVVLTSLSLVASEGKAQSKWKPDRPIEIIVGTDPGSGFDRTARLLQKIWQTDHIVEQTVTVVNKPGGFGAVGWSYMNQHAKSGTYISVMSPLLLTNNIVGNQAMSYRETTPLALLEDEEIVFAVFEKSTIKTGADFIKKLQSDPASVSVGVSGIGGQNHVALALVAQAAGKIDVSKLKVVGFAGSGDVTTAVIGGHVESTASPASTVAPQVTSGRMRAIGVSSEKRVGGTLSDVPTWKEQGVDAVFSNWRGVIGAKDMTPDQIQYWNDIFAKTVQSKSWQDELQRTQLVDHYLDSKATGAFLEEENGKLTGVMGKLGVSGNAAAK